MVLIYLHQRILYIFLPLIQNTMENHTLLAFATAIHQLLARNTPPQPNSTAVSNSISHFQTEFYTQAATKIAKTKSSIAQALQKMGEVNDPLPLSSVEANLLKMVRIKLCMLNRDHTYLFEQGILSIYEQICGLQKTCSSSQVRLSIYNVLGEIRQCCKQLLLHYFLYQEYLRRKQLQLQVTKSQFLCKNDEKIAQDRQLLGQIEKEWQNISIHALLQREIKKYEDKMKEAVEVCRICFSNILLKHIEQHVQICQKHNSLQQLKRQCQSQLIQAKAQLNKKYQQMQLNNSLTQLQLEFLEIAKIILSHKQKTKQNDRRCSLVEKKKVRQVQDIRKTIEDFNGANGDPLLTKVGQLYKQKDYIQRQISYTQTNSYKLTQYSQGNNANKSSFSLKSKASLQKQPKNVKKQSSLFQDSISNNSIAKSESESEKQLDEFKQKSKKCCSRNALKQDYQEPLCPIKHHSSLKQIVEDFEGTKKKVSLQSFQFLKVLGQGAFGKVYMVRRRQTRDIYALKIIKIPQSNIENSIQSIKKQHSIFKKIAGEHLVKAPFSFSQKSCHFFILQYLPGGDLRKLLNEQVYLQEDRARAYLAEIILAIQHLHHFDVIHRDLKPENLVFDKTGHLKLTDFGLSEFQMKEKLEKSHKEEKECIKKIRKRRQAVLSSNKQKMKLIGTPDYIAPEIIFKISSNNFSIDWWSLGVMAYELMIGARPFCAETIEEVIDNITNFNIEWPEVGYEQGMISPQAKDLICRLLDKDFMHRLGANGAEQIKSHPFFAKINWQTIKSVKPLAMPKIANVKQYEKMGEDIHLLKEVHNIIDKGEGKRKVDLQQFVRFDLLGNQTLQSSQMVGEKQRRKLKTLKFLECNFSKEVPLDEG